MKNKNFDSKKVEHLILLALKEDLGKGDITSEMLISPESESEAELLVKEKGIISGLKIFEKVFKLIDKNVKLQFTKKDGSSVKPGDIIGKVRGNTKNLLLGERTGLNILQRMSGIATYTNNLKKKLNNDSIKIIDTRKTTPNFRLFEKLAVTHGGGENHRHGLYDMMLIKDNHIEANGGISETIDILISKKKKIKVKVEIEVKDLKEFQIVVLKGRGVIDRVMLDNFKIADVKEAVKINRGLFELEISGGINENNIKLYSRLKGIDFISVGSLTHSAGSLDISLNFIT